MKKEVDARLYISPEVMAKAQARLQFLRRICICPVPVPRGFFGRSRELVRLAVARKTSRVVTLLGPGGIGKTRLAVEFTAGRVPLVPMNDINTASDLQGALRDALGLGTPGGIRSQPTSAEWLAGRLPRRLILDNAEALDASGAELLSQLLALAPKLSLILTSRRALGIPGEALLLLQPLSDRAARRLFLRTSSAHGKRRPTPALSLIDSARGFPLAIEQAARGGTISQLRPSQKVLLGSLSVFAHSFSDADANAICGPIDPLDFSALEDACLIGRRSLEGRWRMLVPVREAARPLVPQILLEAAHTAHFEALAHAGDTDGLAGAEIELGAVLERLFENGETERASKMAIALATWAQTSGRLDSAERWLKNATEQVLSRELHVEALDALGRVLLAAGRYEESETCLRDVLPYYEESGDVRLEGRAHLNLGTALRMMSRSARAETETRRSIYLLRSIGEERLLGVASNNLAQILGDDERWEESAKVQREAIKLGASDARRLHLVEALIHLGERREALEIASSVLSGTPERSNRALGEFLLGLIGGVTGDPLRRLLESLDAVGEALTIWGATRALAESRI
jgi:tetratricopeptide (TPR) repeat protein